MKKLFVILILVVFSITVSAEQTPAAKELLVRYHTAKQDTAKLRLLFMLVNEYTMTDMDSAKFFLNEGRRLMDQVKTHKFDFEYYYSGIKIYHAEQDFGKALEFNLKALQTAESANNKQDKADALRSLFIIYLNLKKDSLAIQTAHEALSLTEELKDTENMPITFGNLAKLYHVLGQDEKAVEYGKKGIEAGKKYHNLKGLLISMNNTALAYMQLMQAAEAEKIYREQLALAYQNHIPRSAVKALMNLCYIYIDGGEINKLSNTVTELNRYVGENAGSPIDKSDLNKIPLFNGYNQLFQTQYNEAEKTANQGINKSLSNHDDLIQYYNLLTKIQYAKHDFKSGERYEDKLDSVQMIIDKENLTGYEIEAGEKYESGKKEALIALQKTTIRQKNILNYIFAISAIGFLLTLTLAWRNYKHRRKIQVQRIAELETEKQLLATQFLLKGQEEERTRLAKDLHDGLGGLLSGVKLQLGAMKGNLNLTDELRTSYDSALDKLDESINEMRRVAQNMMPEALLKFGLEQALQDYCDGLSASGKFTINREFHGLEKRLDAPVEISIYRIVQELLNNAIKHSGATTILAQVMCFNNNLTITVEDNGKGFSMSEIDTMKTAGFRNIQSRVKYLNAKMDIQSGKEKGTSVYIDCQIENDGKD